MRAPILDGRRSERPGHAHRPLSARPWGAPIGRRSFLASAAAVAVIAWLPRRAVGQPLEPLLPARRNPAAVGMVDDPLVRKAVEVFDGPAEQRWYDRVDQLDGLTIGFGHWPQSELSPKFLKSLRAFDGGRIFDRFVARLAEFYTMSPAHWARAPQVPGPPTADNVLLVLDRTLYAPEVMKRFAKNCSKDSKQLCLPESPSFFREHCHGERDWIGAGFGHALRDPSLVRWQVALWSTDVIGSVRAPARTVEMDDEAGIIALASMRSSAPAYLKDFVDGVRTGTVRRGGFTWNWRSAGGSAPTTPAALASWRRLVAWQWYIARTGRIRGRSQAYFEAFLARDWRLPVMKGDRPDWRAAMDNGDPAKVVWVGQA